MAAPNCNGLIVEATATLALRDPHRQAVRSSDAIEGQVALYSCRPGYEPFCLQKTRASLALGKLPSPDEADSAVGCRNDDLCFARRRALPALHTRNSSRLAVVS